MARVYVHIGLPKTATTTLQSDLFPAMSRHGCTYIGVVQPRTEKSDPLYEQLCAAIILDEGVESARLALQQRLASGESIIFSEEMICSVQSRPWQEKLDTLATILDGLDYRVLLTVREPVAAMFSHFVQQYRIYAPMKKPWYQLAVEHNNFMIYHYEVLLSKLESLFQRERISVAKFEEIVTGEIGDVLDFLDVPAGVERQVVITEHNSKRGSANEVLIDRTLSLGWLRPLYERLGGDGNPLLKAFVVVLRPALAMIRRIPLGSVRIPRPAEQDKQRVRSAVLARGNDSQSRYGIDYRP